MARQPIYNRAGEVYAYELLYRSAKGTQASNIGTEEEAQALANALVDIGLDQLVGHKLAFVNIPESLLHSEALRLLPRERVVLELLETLSYNKETETAINRLLRLRYRVAFDDYIFATNQKPFLDKVSLVKVDVMETPMNVLEREMGSLKERGLKTLAEKVETKEMHRKCMSLGFDFFQGYYYARPELMSSRGIAPRKQVMVSLLAKLQDEDASLTEIEKLIMADANLAFRLLRLVNSAGFGVKTGVASVKVAISMLGISKVQALASLLLISSESGDSPELITTALVRARMCEQLALEHGYSDPAMHFTVGLFSLLDAILDTPMQTVVSMVPLPEKVKNALVDGQCENEPAKTLRLAKKYEIGSFGNDSEAVVFLKVSQFYCQAVEWARELDRICSAA